MKRKCSQLKIPQCINRIFYSKFGQLVLVIPPALKNTSNLSNFEISQNDGGWVGILCLDQYIQIRLFAAELSIINFTLFGQLYVLVLWCPVPFTEFSKGSKMVVSLFLPPMANRFYGLKFYLCSPATAIELNILKY